MHVDDDQSIQEITKLMLLDLNNRLEIDWASCVDEAFKKLANGHYDAVVSDYEMPKKNGLEFLKEFHEQKYEIPFILFTGKGREEVAIKALNLGVAAYHNKQGSPETVYGELAHSIRQVTVHHRIKKSVEERDNRLKKIASQTPGMLYQFARRPDATYYISYSSDYILNIFGCTPQDVKDDFSPIAKVILPEYLNRVFSSIEYSAAHLTPWNCEFRIQRPGQPIRWLFGQSIPEKASDDTIIWSGYIADITERKRAEEELSQKYETLERVGETIDAGLAIINKDYEVFWANSTLRKLGVASNKKCYQTFNRSETICPDCGVKKIFEQNVPFDSHEYKYVNSKGEITWVDLRVTPLKDKNGNVTSALELAVPITERKKAELQLKSLKEFDERIVDSLGEAILIIDPENFEVLNANKAAYEQLNITRKDMIGKTCYETTHNISLPCQAPEHVCPIQEMQKTGKPITVEHTHYNCQHDAVFVEVSAYPIKNAEGKNVVIHVARDITPRKLMEINLQASEEKFRAISNSVQDAIVLVDSKAIIEYWNPAAEKTFGYSLDEALGQFVHELVIPTSMSKQGRRIVERGFEQFVKTGTGEFMHGIVELIGRKKDGSEFPVELSLSPIKLGNSQHVVGVVKDITERKQIEQIGREYSEKLKRALESREFELKAANESLLKLERLAAIGELAGMVGHDLRNPLAGIKNAVYLLKKKGVNLEADQKAMLEIIGKGINHSDKIINDLLEYSKEMQLDLRWGSPRELLAESLNLIKVSEKVEIINKIPNELGFRCDHHKMLRVFSNLINNAIDAMPNGGTITVLGRQIGSTVEISFADTGIGIPEDILPSIFSPLFTTKAQGMGFGLSICKRIVDAHGGNITVKSRESAGTTFTICLPLK